jgi:hypothetical protein
VNVGGKQAVGWMLIAVSGILSVAVFTSAMIERGATTVVTPEVSPIVGVVPVDGE